MWNVTYQRSSHTYSVDSLNKSFSLKYNNDLSTMSLTFPITTSDQMKASFPPKPHPIMGMPTLNKLLPAFNWLIECGWSH